MQFQWKSEWTAPVVAGVVSFGVGALTGYAAHMYKAKRDIQELIDLVETVEADVMQMELELDNRNETIGRIMGNEDPKKPFLLDEDAIQEAVSRMAHPASFVIDEDVVHENEIPESELIDLIEPTSIWPTTDDEPDDWDYEVEERARQLLEPGVPYVIHRKEFEDEDAGYGQSTLSYYQGDDVLCDEHDTPIYNAKDYVPMPLEFGKGSGDPNVIYIRNPRLEAEYEILLDHGHYAVEVLGAEIEHSFERKPPLGKFRSVD